MTSKVISKYGSTAYILIHLCMYCYFVFAIDFLMLRMFEPVNKSVVFLIYQAFPLLVLSYNKVSRNILWHCKELLLLIFSICDTVLYVVVTNTGIVHEDKLIVCHLITMLFYVCTVYVLCDACSTYKILNRRKSEALKIDKHTFYLINEKLKTLKLFMNCGVIAFVLVHYGISLSQVLDIIILVVIALVLEAISVIVAEVVKSECDKYYK